MAKVAGRTRQRPGLFGRTARRTVRLAVLATAVFVGRKTASDPDTVTTPSAAARPTPPSRSHPGLEGHRQADR